MVARNEHIEDVVQAVGDLPGREHRRARGGELDGQRQAVEPPANLHDWFDVLFCDGKARVGRADAVDGVAAAGPGTMGMVRTEWLNGTEAVAAGTAAETATGAAAVTALGGTSACATALALGVERAATS